MCSVVGCDSWRRSAQRFKLPEDPERRLEWVQFLATVNKQRFKESSWTDITMCSEHFRDDCFDNLTPSELTLKPSAVPSLCLRSQEHLESPTCVEPEETTDSACPPDQLCDGPTYFSEESGPTSMAAQGSPLTRGDSCSTSDAFISVYDPMQRPENKNFDLDTDKTALLQLFSSKCPLCGCILQIEKAIHGVLIILNQHCLQCDYRNQWKSQVNARVSTAEDQHLTEVVEVTTETQQAVPTDDTHITGVPEIVAVVDEESDPSADSSEQGDMDSGEDWRPVKGFYHARVLEKKPEEETEEEEEEDDYPPHSQLCTECGMFFNKQKHHTCEHKIKPYPCNICGKRCVSETALNTHSRIHDGNYEYQCKYCCVTFKTKVGKITHEQIHLTEGKPYKCPDCSETFATNKQRRIHLEDHRGPRQLKCPICGIEFLWPLSLQRHLAVHTGVKPFKCSVCQRGFSQASHLKSHMRLHTGERPFKCRHCDKSFNHNVSLKSHYQRYHSSSSGRQQKKKKISKRAGDAEGDGKKRGADDSRLDNVEEEQDIEEEVQKEKIYRNKKKGRSTGRPIGRPKSYESGNLVEGQCSNTKTGRAPNLKRTQCSDEESEDEPSDSDTSFDSAEEEEEEEEESSKKAKKHTMSRRGSLKHPDSDSDFDPEEKNKKRYSSQSKRRVRPRSHLKEDN
ncbi:zinc finger protein 484-like [Cottoperca gobio]|uniref:Zinc finger protein 484-like n=1 Tax=Cottoperca gobio TaxID=56716 RepID=A0A6J2RCL6_COTGO|nr:zinc finger protein 484-like [Cottoperca gobio]